MQIACGPRVPAHTIALCARPPLLAVIQIHHYEKARVLEKPDVLFRAPACEEAQVCQYRVEELAEQSCTQEKLCRLRHSILLGNASEEHQALTVRQ